TNQMIYPGEVNWMIAGNGVTHSERTSAATRRAPSKLLGIQTWVALPEADEEMGAAFEHHKQAALPLIEGEGKQVRIILGHAYGEKAPVKTFSEMFYADVVLEADTRLPMPDDHEDRGLYVVSGSVEIAGDRFNAGRMMVFRPGDAITVKAGEQGARVILLGGETLNGPRHIWWNFVASSREKIDHAKQAWATGDWQAGRFQLPPGDTDEFIPLPGS
ncbi:MAG: pirin family protein, partial [Hyphomicrobiaceae bacterium]